MTAVLEEALGTTCAPHLEPSKKKVASEVCSSLTSLLMFREKATTTETQSPDTVTSALAVLKAMANATTAATGMNL
jgi:hypothetical protein